MPLSTTANVQIEAPHSAALDMITPAGVHIFKKLIQLADGVGASQADRAFSDKRLLGAGANEDLDVVGGALVNPFGAAFTLARLKLLAVFALATNPNNITVGRPAAAGVPFISAVSSGIVIVPGGLFVWVAPTATGIAVAGGASDLINVLAGAGGNHEYEILIIGASA